MAEFRVGNFGDKLDGASEPRRGTVAAICMPRTDDDYFGPASEIICARVAPLIGLDVPPGVLARDEAGDIYFASLDFTAVGGPPSADLAAFVAAKPELAAGVVVFDCWVANEDRMMDNLAYDAGADEVILFDHDQALFGPPGAFWVDDPDDPHCDSSLVELLRDARPIRAWADKVAAVPGDLLRKACEAILIGGIYDSDDANAAHDFLAARQPRIRDLIKGGIGRFLELENPDAI